MAKKKEKEATSRVLTKVIDGVAGVVSAGYSVVMGGGSGWDHVYIAVGTGYDLIYNIQTIDISGYKMKDLTLFPQGIIMQDMQTLPQGSTIPQLTRATMVSTTPISEDDLTNVDANQGNSWHLPGSNSSKHSLDHILQGRLQNYFTLSTYSGLQQTSESMWGSGDSTAADKLWCVDAILIPHLEGALFAAPDQAFVLPSIIAKEADLEYIMRLARSTVPIERS